MARKSREAVVLAEFPTTQERQHEIAEVLGQMPAVYENLGLRSSIDLRVMGGYPVRGWEIGRRVMYTAASGSRSRVERCLFVPAPNSVPEPSVGVLSRTSSQGRPGGWRDIHVPVERMGEYDERVRQDPRLPRWSVARFCSSTAVMLALRDHLLELAAEPPTGPASEAAMEIPVGAPELAIAEPIQFPKPMFGEEPPLAA